MRTRFRVAAFAACAALFATSVYAVATSDAFVRRMVRSALSSFLRGPARVRAASFSFRGGLRVEGLVVLDPSDPLGPPAVEVEELRADYGLFLSGDGPRVTSVVLTRPTVRVRRLADGSLSLGELLQTLPDTGDRRVPPPEVRIEGGTLVWSDPGLVSGGPVTAEDLTASVRRTGDAWRAEAAGRTRELGALSVVAFVVPDGGVTASVDLPRVVLGKGLLERLMVPGAAEASQIGVRGALRAHADVAYGPGRPPSVAAKLDLAGLGATVQLPAAAGAERPQPIEVDVAKGIAELSGGTVVLSRLDVRALGGRVACDRAVLDGLGAAEGPTVAAAVTVEAVRVGPELHPFLPEAATRVLEAYSLRGTLAGSARLSGLVTRPVVEAEVDVTDGAVRFEGYVHDDGVRRGFPYEVSQVTGRATFTPDLVLRLTADGVHGPARLHADGVVDWRTGDEVPEVTIVAHDVPLDADLRAGFQDRAERIFDRWGPSGVARRIEVRVLRDAHEDGPFGSATEILLGLDGAAAVTPKLLPMRLGGVTGGVRILYPSRGDHRAERVIFDDVTAQGDGVAVRVRGHVDVDDPTPGTDDGANVAEDDLLVEVAVEDLAGPVAAAVHASEEFIPQSVKDALRDFGASGPATVRAEVAGDPDRRRDRVRIELRGAAVKGYRDVPFAAGSITGTVTVDGDEAVLEDVRARALGAAVRGSGRLLLLDAGRVEPDVHLTASRLPLGDALRRALGPLAADVHDLWDQLGAAGAADGAEATSADVDLALRPAGSATPVELHLRNLRGRLLPQGLSLVVQDGALDFDGRTAELRLDASLGRGDVTLRRLHLDVATGRIEIDADVRQLDFPEDIAPLLGADAATKLEEIFRGKSVDATDLRVVRDPVAHTLDVTGGVRVLREVSGAPQAEGLSPEGTFTLERLHFVTRPGQPPAFDAVIDAAGVRVHPGFQIRNLRGRLLVEGSTDDEGLDLRVRTDDAAMAVAGFPIRHAQIEARTLPFGARMTARAEFGGGVLTATVGPAGGRYAYKGKLRLENGDLAQIAGSGDDVKGVVQGDVDFENPTGEAADLRGRVLVSVDKGDLGRFPVISTLFDVLATLVFVPSGGSLDTARFEGTLEGPRVRVKAMTIRGPALFLKDGMGTIGLDGALDVSLLPAMTIVPLLPPVPMPFRMHAGGTIGKPDVRARFLSTGLGSEPPKPAEDGE